MSNTSGEWSSAEARPSVAMAMIPVVRHELKRHAVWYAAIFAALALSALAIGVLLPKKYASTTTILVEQSNIITPLMEGRAVPTSVANRAAIAREVAFSRKVMTEVLRAGGWMDQPLSPLAQDKLIEEITGRTIMSNPRDNLIEIRYVDSDPTRTFKVTQRLADLVISESLATKENESREAYDFINTQVEQYHQKLTDAEAKLEHYRNSNPDARPGISADVNSRIGELRRQVETSKLDLIDLRSEETVLQQQLSGESEVNTVQTRAGQFRVRLAELQNQRDQLLSSYTEQHPDVVRTQHQIRDLEQELAAETARQEARRAGAPTTVDGTTSMNPLYGELRSKLSAVRSRGAAVASRIATAQGLLEQELVRNQHIAASESSLAELTRDYEVNRDLYQDLLKRRENARVSMNLDSEQRGLSFRIQEPAAMPLRPIGLRLMHAAGAGLGAAFVVPVALLFGVVKLDPRVRSPLQIERDAALPVLGVMPAYVTPRKRKQMLHRYAFASLLVLLVPATYGIALTLKMMQAL
ncbi:MAG: XrtA system polysaccharide chain length determinant [Pseudoxanthomonas sp.]